MGYGLRISVLFRCGLNAALLFAVCLGSAQAQGDVTKGLYISRAAGCVGCHTDTKAGAVPFAGGRALKTPFGTFYGPNITPHRETGLGTWSEADLRRALRSGERPDGAHYFPAFPYASFTSMTDADISDLWAYLKSLPATNQPNLKHDLQFPFGWRFLAGIWKTLFFTTGPVPPQVAMTPTVARGAYLARSLGHCGECHTPRNFLGASQASLAFAGAKLPDGRAPNLTPTRLKKWSDDDLKAYLKTGMTPDSDIAAEPMNEVIVNTTNRLTPEDLAALISYLRTLPPLPESK